MALLTPRVGLLLPQDPETQDIDQLNANSTKIDKYLGLYECTSATRPTGAAVFPGLQILETDTKMTLIWDGTEWLRPWYLERYRDANIVIGAGGVAYKWNNTRLGVNAAASGAAADWGLTSWTEDKESLTIPRSGMWDINWRIWCAPAPARTYNLVVKSAGGVDREAINQDQAGNAQGEFSTQFYAEKGAQIRFLVSIASAVTGGPDNRMDPSTRSYMKLRYSGPGSA